MMAWMEIVGWAATVIAVAGVVLNNHRRRACFVVWMFSNAGSAAIHLTAGIWALLARDLIFFALAIQGLWLWSAAKPQDGKSARPHQIALDPSIGTEVGAGRKFDLTDHEECRK